MWGKTIHPIWTFNKYKLKQHWNTIFSLSVWHSFFKKKIFNISQVQTGNLMYYSQQAVEMDITKFFVPILKSNLVSCTISQKKISVIFDSIIPLLDIYLKEKTRDAFSCSWWKTNERSCPSVSTGDWFQDLCGYQNPSPLY